MAQYNAQRKINAKKDKIRKEMPDEPVVDPETGEMTTKRELLKKMRKNGHTLTRPKTKTSIVWKYFVRDTEDPKMVTCQICFKKLMYKGSNSSMLGKILIGL